MKTVFELTRISTNSKTRYPLRKSQINSMGLFSTLVKAEAQMIHDSKGYQESECERLKDIAEKEEYHNDEKRFGHDVVLAYRITEYELDTEVWKCSSTQSVRTYTADGQPNDECLLDAACKRQSKAARPNRFASDRATLWRLLMNGRRNFAWSVTRSLLWNTMRVVGNTGWRIIGNVA